MSQADVLQFLRDMRDQNDGWYRVKDIQPGLSERAFSNGVLRGVSDDLISLMVTSEVEWKGIGIWNHYKTFRALEKKEKAKR